MRTEKWGRHLNLLPSDNESTSSCISTVICQRRERCFDYRFREFLGVICYTADIFCLIFIETRINYTYSDFLRENTCDKKYLTIRQRCPTVPFYFPFYFINMKQF